MSPAPPDPLLSKLPPELRDFHVLCSEKQHPHAIALLKYADASTSPWKDAMPDESNVSLSISYTPRYGILDVTLRGRNGSLPCEGIPALSNVPITVLHYRLTEDRLPDGAEEFLLDLVSSD